MNIAFHLLHDARDIEVRIHEAQEGGYWAEVPAIPGCATEGDTFAELLKNLHEAIAGCIGNLPSMQGKQSPMGE
jgi:predicted RNase H-like HicB family nuclease